MKILVKQITTAYVPHKDLSLGWGGEAKKNNIKSIWQRLGGGVDKIQKLLFFGRTPLQIYRLGASGKG